MENCKIYVVTNVNKLKELFEEKLSSNITADNYIDMENMRNEKVHLVERNVPEGYSTNDETIYDIYIHSQNGWKLNNIAEITDSDIQNLYLNCSIENIEDYKHWKNVTGFKVIDTEKFYSKIFDLLTDRETIGLINMVNRCFKVKTDYEFYIICENGISNVYINEKIRNIAYKLPYTDINKEDLSDFIKNGIISSKDCKINKNTDRINFDGITSIIGLEYTLLRGIRVYPRGDYYIARTPVRTKGFHERRVLHVVGPTERDALHGLSKKLTELFMHDNKDITYETYKHLIMNQKELDM